MCISLQRITALLKDAIINQGRGTCLRGVACGDFGIIIALFVQNNQ
jgi:hypothetical protein